MGEKCIINDLVTNYEFQNLYMVGSMQILRNDIKLDLINYGIAIRLNLSLRIFLFT